MKITTTYPELPDDVKSAIAELNALINVTAAMVNPKTKDGFIVDTEALSFENLKKMSEITQKLMREYPE